MSVSLREKIRTCDSLPSLPAAALYVLELAGKKEAEVDELAKTISQDPALSLKILRAVNSPFYGLGQKVSSVQQAVALLGIHSVKTLVLGFSLVQSLRTNTTPGFNHLEYWRRSMFAATAARVIASRMLPSREEDCFVAALLMDIGALVLDQLLGEKYDTLYEKTVTHSELMALEAHHLGLTHPEAAGLVAEHWSLPEELKVPIESHHAPHDVNDAVLHKVTEIVWLAGRCADVFVNRGNTAESVCAVRKSFQSLYKLDELQADSLMCVIARKTHELAALFDVRINAQTNFEEIIKAAHERLLELSVAERDGTGEHRKSARVRRDGKINIAPCSRGVLGKALPVRLRDVSTCGIGLTYTEEIPKGTEFVIQLPVANETKTLLYTVCRCDKIADLWHIGGELTSVLRPDKVQPISNAA